MRYVLLTVLTLLSALGSRAMADVRMPSFFGKGMVIQQNLPIRVWGWADAGEQVTVVLGDSSATAQADSNGRWRVELPAREARAPHAPLRLTVSGRNTLTIDDVLIGEVWLCSGQSNMAMKVVGVRDAETEIAAAEYPQIRLLQVHRAREDAPENAARGTWVVCSPATAKGFSAVGYFFGRELHKNLEVPVGLINASVNGTLITSWMPVDVLRSSHGDLIEQLDAQLAASAEKRAAAKMGKPNGHATDARAVGGAQPDAANKPNLAAGAFHKHTPGILYQGLIAPLAPMNIRGVIWYQGEANTRDPDQYESLLRTLIRSWRAAFENPQLCFGVVQLANFGAVQDEAEESHSWADLRDAQRRVAASTPGVGLAVTLDIGEARNIHPTNKQDVGRRLAAWALHSVYGRKDVVPSGPLFKGMTSRDGKLVLSFDYAEGLTVKGDKLGGFVIAGSDGKFVFADAVVEGNTVVVSSPTVTDPKAVRYGWANNPVAHLYNAAGLPAAPFGTDRLKPRATKPTPPLPDGDTPTVPGK